MFNPLTADGNDLCHFGLFSDSRKQTIFVMIKTCHGQYNTIVFLKCPKSLEISYSGVFGVSDYESDLKI